MREPFQVMKILAFSDVARWEGYEGILDKTRPDITVLAGDLTSDGFASFWHEAFGEIPEFQREKKQVLEKYGVVETSKDHYDISKARSSREWNVEIETLRSKYRDTERFHEIRKGIHVDRFYQFLEYAGKISKVLVVKGDHDEDFEGDYVVDRIHKISGCREISGRTTEVKGLRFLGLGFGESHYLRNLRPIIEEFEGKVDVVIAHCEQKRVPTIGSLRPRIMIRGHFGSGKYLVNNIPSVFTQGVKYTTVELENERIPRILQYRVVPDIMAILKGSRPSHKLEIMEKGSCRPLFSKVSEFERYRWLKPYPRT